MVEKNEIMIRSMKDGEQKEIVRVGKRAFKLMEAWFVGTPKLAMVADYNGKIVQKSVDNPKCWQSKSNHIFSKENYDL